MDVARNGWNFHVNTVVVIRRPIGSRSVEDVLSLGDSILLAIILDLLKEIVWSSITLNQAHGSRSTEEFITDGSSLLVE